MPGLELCFSKFSFVILSFSVVEGTLNNDTEQSGTKKSSPLELLFDYSTKSFLIVTY